MLNTANRVDNFSCASMLAAQAMNIEYHIAGNWGYKTIDEMKADEKKYGIYIHQIDFIRNPFDPRNIKAYQQLLYIMKSNQFYMIHCNTPIGGLCGRLAAKKCKIKKVIYQAHGFHFYRGAPLFNNTILKWVEKWLASYTDVIITMNQEDYSSAKKFKMKHGGQVVYGHGVGIDSATIANTTAKRSELLSEICGKPNSVLIISSGELNQNKNNKIIFEALYKMQNKNIHYLLCGIGKAEEELREAASQYKIADNIHCLGYRNDIYSLLKSCDIFVMPSFREGLSRSLMEAMAAGLPCIVSKIRGNTDLIIDGKGGYLMPPKDVNGFAHAIMTLANDKSLRQQMGAYNTKAVEQFDMSHVKEEMQKIYQEVLNR